jgi:hypothetical protein
MTVREAQQIYMNKGQRDFALTFKSHSKEMQEELNAIHAIQTALWRMSFYCKRENGRWDSQTILRIEQDKVKELYEDYTLMYGEYLVNTPEQLADLGLNTAYQPIEPLV